MRRILILTLALAFTLSSFAQTKKPQQKARTTVKRTAPVQKKTTTAKKAAPVKKTATTQKKAVTTKKATTKKTATTQKKPVYTNTEIKGLQSQRAQIQKKIKEQEKLLQANRADVKDRLNNLYVINSEIEQHQKSIEGIERDITSIEGNIELLKTQLSTLEKQLDDKKAKYVKSLRYMARHRSFQEQLMFIFSAKNLGQMYRRMRFVRRYAAYQRAQGEQLKTKQLQIAEKQDELKKVRGEKSNLLYKGKKEKAALQGKQEEQQQVVSTLQRQQKVIQGVIDEQRKKDQELNAQIDRLVAEEMAKARLRAAEEARKKAAELAAAKKKREEELARKKAEAEKAAKENERRIAEAKAKEAKAKEEARTAARKKDEEAKERAEAKARAAQADREAVERKAAVENKRRERELAEARKETTSVSTLNTEDRRLSSSFEGNKGRLPRPVSGRIVRHYGQNSVDGLKGVMLDNKGVHFKASSGATVSAVFNGEVSAVYNFGGSYLVMVRHGGYISVYCNLGAVSVSKGKHVNTGQTIGSVGSDGVMQFQLRRMRGGNAETLNPEAWIR